jgi:dipeptidyl aminopeptidase/acylaminoacyl peptidase
MRNALLTLFVLLCFGAAAAQSPSPLVAFVEEGNLYLWQDGTRTALRDTGDVTRVWLSPDGTRIAFTQDDGIVDEPGFEGMHIAGASYYSTSLWIMNIDGTDLRQLVNVDDFRGDIDYSYHVFIFKLVWVPQTSLIAFNTIRMAGDAPFSWVYADLYAVDTETGERVLSHPSEEYGMFAISPDGQHAAITTDTAISIIGLDGEMVLPDVYTFELSIDTPHSNYFPPMRWAADGQSLIAIELATYLSYTDVDEDGKTVHPSVEVVRIHMDGTTEVLATETQEDFRYWTIRFAPDGEQAVYGTGTDDACGYAAFALSETVDFAPDSQNTVLCFGRDDSSFLAFAPDGSAYRLEQRGEEAGTLSRVCEDFTACEDIQELPGKFRSFEFVSDTQFIYLVAANESGEYSSYSDDLYYGELGEEPQHIATLIREYPADLYSVYVP